MLVLASGSSGARWWACRGRWSHSAETARLLAGPACGPPWRRWGSVCVYGRGSVAGHLGRTEIGTHEHCRCTCKMYLAGTGYSGAREVLSSVAEARQTADGRRQTGTLAAGVNYVACRQRHWAAGHAGRRCSHDAAAACHWPDSCHEGAYTAACTTTHLHHEPASPLLGHTPTKTETKTRTKTWPVPDSTARCIHPRAPPPTVRCLSRCFGPPLASWHLTSPLPTTSSRHHLIHYPPPNHLPKTCTSTWLLTQPTVRPAASRKMWPGVLRITTISKSMQPHYGADLQLRLQLRPVYQPSLYRQPCP
jgi:hypothetical protein